MNRILFAYKDGWRVLLRWLWFSFILALLQLPFSYVFEYTLGEAGYGEVSGAVVFLLLGLFIVTVLPFLLYWVSEWTGEFVGPRISRKRFDAIKSGPLQYRRPAGAPNAGRDVGSTIR